jgi:hypothetical protein
VLNRIVAQLLVIFVAILQVQPANAQTTAASVSTPTQARPSSETTPPSKLAVGDCAEHGRSDCARIGTVGAFAAGFAGGLCLGPIGATVAYFGQSKSGPSRLADHVSGDGSCRSAYVDAYGAAHQRNKRRAALTGGLLGTAVLVTLSVVALSNLEVHAW